MEIEMSTKVHDSVHNSSPCAGCPKDRPGKSCLHIVENGISINGCAKWYSWASDCWRSIHRQGLEAIERKRPDEGSGEAAGGAE